MPVTTIGKEIGLSRTAIQDRIRRMEERRIITGYSVDIADENQDDMKALVFMTFATRPCAPILDWLRDIDGVMRVISLSGELDCVVEVAFPTALDLSAFGDHLLTNERILTVKTQIILSE